MKEAWVSSCISTIQGFVERSTRLQPDKLGLKLQEQIDFNYQISLRLGFRVELEKQRQEGRVGATNNTLVFFNSFKYSEALKAETSAVLSRQETLREVHTLVLSRHYGEIRKEAVVYSHPRSLCLTENCSNCGGRGQVNCSSCSGSGKINCSGCGGSGQVLEQRTVYDHYSKQNRIESHYRGCYSCSSSGKVYCNHCAGSGNQQCSPCKGTGLITQITKLHTVVIPEYQLIFFRKDVQQFIKDGLYKAGIPNLEHYGVVELENSEIQVATNNVSFLFNAETPFARLNSPLPQGQNPNQKIQWIVYGIRPQILDAGHVIELMLKNDLDNLVYKATKGKLLNPFIGKFSCKTISTFMESEAHQDMLDANRSGKTGEMLREALNRGVSTTYLEESLNSLKSIMSAIQNWSVIKWGIFTSLIIYILMPFYTAYNNAWFSHKSLGRVYLTPHTNWDSQQNLQSALQELTHYCGLFIVILGLVIPLLGYTWRRGWVQWKMGKHLSDWAVSRSILRSRWLLSLIMTVLLTVGLLLFFPLWITQDGDLFGQYSFLEPLNWIASFVNNIKN